MVGNMGCRRGLKRTGIAIAVAQAVVVNVSHAASITVTNGGDASNGCTLREAVAIVNAGSNQSNGCVVDTRNDRLGVNDTIEFNVSSDSISLTAGEILIASDVSINPGGSAITIDGNRNDRLLNINDANVLIDSLTLINGVTNSAGNAGNGGAISAYSSTLTINNSNITGNGAVSGAGGGISVNRSSTVTLNNSSISDNYANGIGGGVDVSFSSTLSLNNSNVSRNVSEFCGGGIHLRINSVLTATNSSIEENITFRGGGGIYSSNNSVVTLANSTISGNEASSFIYDTDGGGIDARSSTVTLSDTTLSDNYADGGGGGINAESSTVTLSKSVVSTNTSRYNAGLAAVYSQVMIDDSTISENTAASANGGIFTISSSLSVTNSTISENLASVNGALSAVQSSVNITNSTISGNSAFSYVGGIYSSESSLTLTNTTVSENTALYFAGINVNYGSIDLRNTIVSGNSASARINEMRLNGVVVTARSNLIGDSSQSLEQAIEATQGSYGFESPSFGNIIATSDGNAPTAVTDIILPLANNGGPTQTHALIVDSPAVDAGNSAFCAANPVNNLDQRGESRPVGDNCDIGSFEGEQEPVMPTSDFFVVPLPNGNSVVFSL